MHSFRQRAVRALAILIALAGLGACSPRQLVIGSVAEALAAQGQSAENDPELARDAAAFYLKLSESILRQDPGHGPLALAVASGFAQYAYAFVAFEADQVESRDARAAERLRQRAAGLYARARHHALGALERQSPGFAAALNSLRAEDWPRLAPHQVGLAYWAAAAWGGWISLAKDDPEVVADLPQAVRLAQLAWQVDPAWGAGSLTSLVASFESARPGGNRDRAAAYFDQAIAQSGGEGLGPLLAKAEGLALPAGDRPLYESLLRQALARPVAAEGPGALQDAVLRRRARWLLETAADRF